MHRYFIHLSFDGTAYHGWQVQPNGNSVQAELQRALSLLLRAETTVVGAGRTDAGVHARHMVAHFDTTQRLDGGATAQLAYRLNRVLPRDIAVQRIEPVGNGMHARFSAYRRTYRYYIHTKKSPFLRHYSLQMNFQLDFGLMARGCEVLKRQHDFTAFCKTGADNTSMLCDVYEARWIDLGQGAWCFEIAANRFLRNMVRAVVGTLVDLGRHKISLDDFTRIVAHGTRCDAGESMPAHALFLENVEYPPEADLTPRDGMDAERTQADERQA